MVFYKGFNTKGYELYGTQLGSYDIECINQDIINQIYTSKGQRLHDMQFGTSIPELVFDLNDGYSTETIKSELEQVIEDEPRVVLKELKMIPDETQGILIAYISLFYKQFNVTDFLNIKIKSN